MRKITGWFCCEYPGCPVETDSGYEVEWKKKKIKVCEDCFKKCKADWVLGKIRGGD